MSLSNTTLTALESSPYFDDLDEAKNFHRILHRPAYAIQTRELNQLQSILQGQIDRFGRHIFKDGSPVLGGQLTLDVTVKSIRVLRTFGSTTIDWDNFFDPDTNTGLVLTGQTSLAKARVLQVDADSDDTHVFLIVSYLTSATFSAGETLNSGAFSATVAAADTNPFDSAAIVSIDTGIYFINGFFVRVAPHSLVLDPQSSTPSIRVGLSVTEAIITEDDDTTLLDNALGSTNYTAPGAHRLQIELALVTKTLDGTTPESSSADEGFIELMRVVDGQVQKQTSIPQYADLEKTLARRTYDESGDYTVRPFVLQVKDDVDGNADNFTASLDPGKAYVRGFEFETLTPTNLTIKRGRTTEAVENLDVNTTIGNYFMVNGVVGFLNTQTQDTLDLHCVAKASVSYTNNTVYNATKIGSARIRSMVYNSGGADTERTFQLYVTDLRTNAISFTANTSNSTGIILNTGEASAVNDAYVNGKLTIMAGPGVGQTFTITAYTGASKFAALTPTLPLDTFSANTTTTCRLDFTVEQIDSYTKTTLGAPPTTSANGNIAVEGRIGEVATGNTILFETDRNSLIFPMGQNWVRVGSVGDVSYEILRPFTGSTFTGNSTVTTLTLTTSNADERFYPAFGTLSVAESYENYSVFRASNGELLPFDANNINQVVINTVGATAPGTITFTANATQIPASNQVSIMARINITNGSPRTKSLVVGNTTATDGATNTSIGQIVIAVPNTTPGVVMSLGIPDVANLVAIYQTANTTTAPNTTYMVTDIKEWFTFDDGQRDNIYDHANIRLKPGATAPSGQLLVIVNYYSHTGGRGYFTGDSYVGIDYEDIPAYTSPSTGQHYELRDSIDFRPTRSANTSEAFAALTYTVDNAQIPFPDTTFQTDYEYYIGRIDKLTLSREREFNVIEGVAAFNPLAPPDDTDSMTLYVLRVPPYTANTNDVKVEFVENKRYTMRDIGRLEKRVERVEYYTALSFVEKQAKDSVLLDDNSEERFKSGILVDSFSGHSVGDVLDPDYDCSIDPNARELRPGFSSEGLGATFTSAASENVQQTGDLLTLAYTSNSFISQPLASKVVNINPFQVTNFLGRMKLFPSSDVWIDTVTLPPVNINLAGENDNWSTIGFGTEWGDWQTRWTGITSTFTEEGMEGRNAIVRRTIGNISENQQRVGTATSLVATTVTRNVGNRVVDVSITPFMRSANVWFSVSGLKPGATVRGYFDGTDVTNYLERANILTMSGNVAFSEAEGIFERVTSNTSANVALYGTGRVIAVRGNKVKVVESQGEFIFANGSPALLTGSVGVSPVTGTVTAIEHWSGPVAGANSTAMTLNVGASANNDHYNSMRLYVVRGPGAGTYADIWDYDGTTKVASINVSTSTVNSSIVNTSSRYSIGNMITDAISNSSLFFTAGDVHGVFYLPSTTTLRFRSGERLLRLTDNVSTVVATTAADSTYRAQGTTQSVEALSLSTRNLSVQRSTVTEDRSMVVNRTVLEQETIGWVDPIAQTFLVDSQHFPAGLCLTKVKLFFKSKDDNGLPVTVQIRPTLNGYPAQGLVLPFAEVTLNPNQVNVSELPSTSNANTITTFTFPAPVYLQPGEYAIVALSNSLEYEVYTAEIGGTQINSTRKISEQPYAGSFFKSQNASTWTAVQEEDLMFVLERAVFDTDGGSAELSVKNPSANVLMDVVHLASGHLDFAGTQTAFAYKGTNTAGSMASSFTTIFANQDTAPAARLTLLASGNTATFRATMTTTNDAVSPLIDLERFMVIGIEQRINNGGVIANGFSIISGGTGYGASANVVLTLSGGGGSGASAIATTNASGVITSVTITGAGLDYSTSPTVAVGGAGSGASITYNGEDSASGGNHEARYITRRVTLADGFDAGDLVGFCDAFVPGECDVEMFYKVLAHDDPYTFERRQWKKMTPQITQVGPTENRFVEMKFTTPSSTAAYVCPDTSVEYLRFQTFAIKIVMRSTNTTKVPRVRNLRVIALDE